MILYVKPMALIGSFGIETSAAKNQTDKIIQELIGKVMKRWVLSADRLRSWDSDLKIERARWVWWISEIFSAEKRIILQTSHAGFACHVSGIIFLCYRKLLRNVLHRSFYITVNGVNSNVFTCLVNEKQAQVTGGNPKNMHFFDLKVALFGA